ncbi:MAG: hypothetical protein M1823_003158 [Watsoniomyces obsoletus]|nr:MAG: hypothetical protein M1823_003158 [Watsoniomyces obsoletus]
MSDSESAVADNSSSPERVAIGISFGNSNSSIAHTSSEGNVEVIANEEGDRQIPSIISYTSGDEFHGTQAKAQLIRNSSNTIAYFRDCLGKSFEAIDPTACHASAHPIEHASTVAFTVQEGVSEETSSTLSVSEVTTRHLRRLKASASEYLGKEVNAAVITVPTDFSALQRAALVEAAKNAGLEVLQLMHEPIAALLAYDARQDSSSMADKIFVVADLGGTRSDAAVVASRGGIYTILATSHEYSLGGTQLDQVLIDFFAKEFIKKHKTDPRENARSLAKLKLESEGTKKALSLGTSASLSIESLADGIDFSSTVNRTRYELLAGKVFGGFTGLVERVVKKADLDVLDIDEVILSGGTSHTPKIARMIQSLFQSSSTTTTVIAPSTSSIAMNPSELAVRGAAIQASLIQEFDAEDIEQSSHPMVTVTPHLSLPIGVVVLPITSGTTTNGTTSEANDGKDQDEGTYGFQPLLQPETAIPARRTGLFKVPNNKNGGSRDVLIRLCEGIKEIKITHPDSTKKSSKSHPKSDDDDEEDDDEDEDEEEQEEIRSRIWKPGTILAETALRNVKKGKKVEVMVHVNADSSLTFTVREEGVSTGGVRGVVDRPKSVVE